MQKQSKLKLRELLDLFAQFVCLLQLGIAFNLFRAAYATAEDMTFKT